MFFTYADKQGSIFSDAWQVRQVAFDTLRRYLYYSAPLKDGRVLTPIDTELTPATAHAAAATTSAHACATTSSNAPSSSAAAAAGTSSSLPSAGRRGSGHISAHTATLRHSSTTDVTTLVPAVVAASTTPRTSVTAAAAPPSSPSTAHSNSSSGTFVAAAATAAPPRSPASPRPDHATAASWPHHASPPRPSPHSLQTATTTTATTTQPSADVCGPHEVTWKKKIKVDALVLVTKEHHFSLDDVHLCEQDFFQVEVYGDTRPLALGESPSPGPLLCASAGLDGLPARCTVSNDDYLHDRFFLRELYESLRDQFVNLRIERERVDLAAAAAAAAAASGGAASGGSGNSGSGGAQPPQREEEWRQPPRLRTLQSPRKKGAPLQMGSRVKIVLRLRNEYEFRRFTYVVLTVLGYDKLCSRPFRGLPPYDPRNGLVFAQIPMCVWQSFRALDRAVFYTFLRCDVVGRGSDGDLTIYLRGGYLCITHDAVLVLRDAGHVPRWVRLVDVHTFCYNASCHRPYMAFLSDGLAVDLVVLPQHPVYGPEAIRHFSAAAETLRVRHVMHEISFASLDIRRVVRLVEVADASVRAFVTRHEQESGTRLKLEPLTDANSSGNTNNSGAAVLSATDSGSSSHRVLRRGSSNSNNNDIDYTRLAGPMGLYYANTSLLQQPSRHHHHHQQQRTPRDEGGGSGGNGPLPQEQLAQVWRDVQHIYASRDPLLVSQAAIPLYENNTNDAHLTRDQLDALERLMSRERASEEDIVGMSYEEIQQVELQHAADALRQRARERRHGERHGRTQQQRRRHSASHHRRRHRRHHDDDDSRNDGDNNDDDSRTHASRHRSRTATSTLSQRPSSPQQPQAATRTHDSAARHSSTAGGARAVHVYHQRQHRSGDERDGSRNSSNNSRHRRPRGRHSHTHRQQPQQDDHGEARAEGARTHAAVTATARLQSSPSPLSRGRTRPQLPSLSPLASPEEAALPCHTAARHRTSATTAAGGEAAAAAATAGGGAAGSEAVATSPSRSRGADDATSDVGNYSLRDSSRGSNSSSVSSSRRRHRQRRSDSSATVSSSSSSSSSSSAPSDYVVPGSRYITRDELAQQLDTQQQQQQPCLPQLLHTPLPLPVIEEHHVVLSSQSPASSTRSHSPPPPLQQQQRQQQNADKSNDATSSYSNTQRQQQQEQQPHDDSAHAQRHERHTGMHVTSSSSSSSSRNNNDRGSSGRGGLRSSNHFAASEPNVSVMAERSGDTQRARGSARTLRDSCPQAGGSGGGGGGGGNASVRAQRSTA